MNEWKVAFEVSTAVGSLKESIRQGPILDDRGRRSLTEAEVDRIDGLKVEIFAREHPPPHFRVSFQGDSANFAISDCRQINGGLKKYYRNICAWHRENKGMLIAEWNRLRPTNCPVGEYRET